MALRYPCPRVQLGMSNSQRNLDEAKANIQMQKTGQQVLAMPKLLPASDLER
jgi:hypothetical protein